MTDAITTANNTANAAAAARKFFRLAEAAAQHGGFWVSAAGGTANVVAGTIARRFGISFEEALRLLDETGREWGGDGWYATLAYIQPFPWDAGWGDDVPPGRFDARTIARAACRAAQ